MKKYDIGAMLIAFIETIIFNVRWMLMVFFLGLIAVLGLYGYAFITHVIHLFTTPDLTSENMLMVVLECIDIGMVAFLTKMIITGSYHSFVSKNHGHESEHISSGMLKVKMGLSIIGVSSIHLLQSFINDSITPDVWHKQIAIHCTFIGGALVMAIVELIHVYAESIETKTEKESHEKH